MSACGTGGRGRKGREGQNAGSGCAGKGFQGKNGHGSAPGGGPLKKRAGGVREVVRTWCLGPEALSLPNTTFLKQESRVAGEARSSPVEQTLEERFGAGKRIPAPKPCRKGPAGRRHEGHIARRLTAGRRIKEPLLRYYPGRSSFEQESAFRRLEDLDLRRFPRPFGDLNECSRRDVAAGEGARGVIRREDVG